MMGTAKRYQVEQTYENFKTGERWIRVLPKVYKSLGAATNRARNACWATCPDGKTKIDSSTGKVVEVKQ